MAGADAQKLGMPYFDNVTVNQVNGPCLDLRPLCLGRDRFIAARNSSRPNSNAVRDFLRFA